MHTTDINYRSTFGAYALFYNIEDDPVTTNGNVVFKHVIMPKFLYRDKPGNWIVGQNIVKFIIFKQ